MNLPEITEVQRFTYKPGDWFILRFKGSVVTQEQARDAVRKFRAVFMLPDYVPIGVVDDSLEILIVEPVNAGDPGTFPIVCANGCPEGYLGCHKFSCAHRSTRALRGPCRRITTAKVANASWAPNPHWHKRQPLLRYAQFALVKCT